MAVNNCGRLTIPLLNSSALPGERLYGVYLTFLITAIVICCHWSLILFPSSTKFVNVLHDLLFRVLSRASALVRSVARYGLTVARYNSFIGSNALFCRDRYMLSLDDLFHSNINLSNFTFANSRHNLISVFV